MIWFGPNREQKELDHGRKRHKKQGLAEKTPSVFRHGSDDDDGREPQTRTNVYQTATKGHQRRRRTAKSRTVLPQNRLN